jgi:hypothetical protein
MRPVAQDRAVGLELHGGAARRSLPCGTAPRSIVGPWLTLLSRGITRATDPYSARGQDDSLYTRFVLEDRGDSPRHQTEEGTDAKDRALCRAQCL